jgi:YHS domain-containing protein
MRDTIMAVYIQGKDLDPVCGMEISPASTNLVSTHKGRRYYFCAECCKEAFEKKPDKYLKPKGPFGRFLDRLTKANEKVFGRHGPSCH